jgi:hypothetical protein
MTADELNALQPGTLFYIPTTDDVQAWIYSGPVVGRDWHTLTYPPDQDGVVSNKRPVYVSSIDLLHATLDETSAWQHVKQRLDERVEWIQKRKLNQQ